ncbi:MAG: family 10 glycosylhydrolase [Victivallaceae bacterium]|nr:family 10 glycosylhydrolase [Victivallaceae bacterium]
MKKLVYGIMLSLTVGVTALANNISSENWQLKWGNEKGSGQIQSTVKRSGKYALASKTPTAKSKALFLRSQKIPVQPGAKYILSGYIKSTTAKAGDARIILQYLDKQSKYITASHGIYGGGKHDWKYFKRTTTIPAGVYYVRLVAGNYMAAGTSWFDDIKLAVIGENGKILASDGFEQVIEKSANVWSIPIKVPAKKINALVEINELRGNYDLIHFSGKNTLKYFSLTCDYNVIKPGQCYLSSDVGTCYWYAYNLNNLGMSLLWSDEKIDLTTKGKKEIIIPFQSRYNRYFDPLTKGPGTVRGHHYFRIYAPGGKALGSSQSVNALIHPEAAVFGKRQAQLSKSNRNSLYTLANLKNYKLVIDKFQADWQPNGKFAFKIQVKDADGDTFDLNKVTVLRATADGKTLTVSPRFAPYDIPTGWFVGKFADKVPETLNISTIISINSSNGSKKEQVTAQFSKHGKYPKFVLNQTKKVIKNPDTEVRMVFITPHSVLSKDPAKGKKQIQDIVQKAKAANINILAPFAIGNRALDEYNTNNKYHTRIFKQYDPLKLFREECTKAGIELHPSICLLPEGAEKLKGILKEHPEWAMRSVKKRKGWLDPSVPEVKAYRLKEIIDLVKRYKLDGIMLDYARLSLRPSDRGAEIYQQQFGIDPRKYSYGSPEHIKWYKWASSHLDGLVGQIHTELKKINPKIKLSAYIQGDKYAGDAQWENLHQNHLKWVKKGYIDILCPTGYIYDMLHFRAWSKRQIDTCREANPSVPCAVTIGVMSSHGALNSPEELVEQVNILRQLGGDGASFFRWKYLAKWLKPLKKDCYSQPAEIP